MTDIKGRKVLRVNCHIGVYIGRNVLNALYVGKDGVEVLELHPNGIYIKSRHKSTLEEFEDLVPYANVVSMRLEPLPVVVEAPKPAPAAAKKPTAAKEE